MKYLILVLTIFLVACSSVTVTKIKPSSKKQVSNKIATKNKQTVTAVKLPVWVNNQPENNNNFIYALGVGNTFGEADKKAIEELSHTIESIISTENKTIQNQLEENDQNSFYYFSKTETSRKSSKRLIGSSIEKRYNANGEYYALAKLDLAKVRQHDDDIKRQVEYLYSSAKQQELSQSLKLYFEALANLTKAVYPIYINEQPAFALIVNSIRNITSNIEPNIGVVKSKLGENSLFSVNFAIRNSVLKNLQAKFNNKNIEPDSYGKYYLNYDEFKNEKTINSNIDFTKFLQNNLGLSNFEWNKLLNLVSGFNKNYTIRIPENAKKIKAYVSVTKIVDSKIDNSRVLVERYKSVLKQGKLEIVPVDYCDVNIEIRIETYLSSTLDGMFVYKSKGHLYVNGKTQNFGQFTYDSVNIAEKTKVFNANKNIAVNKSASILANIIEQELKLVVKKIKK